MNRRPTWLVLLTVLFVPLSALAAPSALEREIVVTATRLEKAAGATGASISVVSADELSSRQITRAARALEIVPGAYVAESGSPGGPASIFLRGAGSNQTIVLVDGVQVNDPTIGGQFNPYDLDLLNVERVEVLRGAASTFYGSDAIGGVVNIVTRRGDGDPRFRAAAEGGSYGHYRASLASDGRVGDFDWSVAAGRDRWRNDIPNHEFRTDSAAASLGLDLAEGTRVELRTRYFASKARDPWAFPFGEQIERDPNTQRRRRTALVALTLGQELGEELDLSLTASQFDVRSRLSDGPDEPGGPDEFESRADADVRTVLLTATWTPEIPIEEVDLRLMAGFEYEDEISESDSRSPFGATPKVERTVRNRAAFLLLDVDTLDRLTLSGGLRRDRNSFFGGETTATASVLYRLEETDTTIRGNYGEAFRAPKPAEFDDPWIGNADLLPEKGVSADVGVEQALFEGDLVVSATAFRLRGTDFIAYDFDSFRLENFDRVLVRGLEFALDARPVEGLKIRGWLTLQDPLKESAGPGEEERLPKRAKRFGGADVSYETGPFTFGASAIASDDYPAPTRITPDGVRRNHPGRKLLIGLRAAWRPAEGVRVTARVENLLDRTWYDDENSPDGLGRGFYLGVAVDF